MNLEGFKILFLRVKFFKSYFPFQQTFSFKFDNLRHFCQSFNFFVPYCYIFWQAEDLYLFC